MMNDDRAISPHFVRFIVKSRGRHLSGGGMGRSEGKERKLIAPTTFDLKGIFMVMQPC